MTTNWLVALLLAAMAASVTGSRRFGECGFDQVPTVFPALRSRSASRAAPHQASLPSRLRQADHHLTIVDAPFDHRPAVGSLGWNWMCMLVVVALTLGVPIPIVRRHNRRPRVSATGTAPAKLAWLVLSTLATASFKGSPKNTSKVTLIRRHFVPLLLLLLVSDRTQGAAAFDSTPQSLPSVAGTGDRGYDAKPAPKLGSKTAAVQNLSKPSPSPSASSDCPAQCLDRSIPWWYREECQACQGMRRMVGNELTWTCSPTWPPQKLFIIFSMQRSATQTACFGVDSLPDTACLGELLNQGLYPNTTDPERILHDAFEATHSASGLAPCTWGFRLLYQDGMLYPQLLKWLWSIVDASIILERSNGVIPHEPPSVAFPTECACAPVAVTGQLESLKRAQATGCWGSRSFCPHVDVSVSQQDVSAHAAKVHAWYSAVREHAVEHPRIPLLSLSTEDFLQIPQTLQSSYLGSFLQTVEFAATAPSKYTQQAMIEQFAGHGRAIPLRHSGVVRPWLRNTTRVFPFFFDGTPVPLPADNDGQWITVCLLPKSGSTAIKRAIITGLSDRGYAFDLEQHSGCRSVHCAALPYTLPGSDAFDQAPAYMIVRHPVVRLLSGWLDSEQNITFESLVNAVIQAVPEELNPDYRLQSDQCGVRLKQYTILKLESIAEWRDVVFRKLGIARRIGMLDIIMHHNPRDRPTEQLVGKHYNDALLSKVNAWAQADLQMFGYMPAIMPTEQRSIDPAVPPKQLQLRGSDEPVAMCDLCAEQWVFVLATGRSGSTSIVEALNSLPGVSLSDENQASLDVSATLLERYSERLKRMTITPNATGMVESSLPHELLCSLQGWYRSLIGLEMGRRSASEASARPVTLGLKELITLRSRSTFPDHDDRLPPARHLPVDADKPEEPLWLQLLDEVFPCARIIFNARRNTTAQARSAFHGKQGTTPHELDVLNRQIERYHAARGGHRSFRLDLEEFSPLRFDQLAQWLGLGCSFVEIPHANADSSYSSDLVGVQYRCSPIEPKASPLSARLTVGIKHSSSFADRRRKLAELLVSIRSYYPAVAVVVAYDGDYEYAPPENPKLERFVWLRNTTTGLSHGRNQIVAHTNTEFVMIIDDDVLFHASTRLEVLVGHLDRNPQLALAAACYAPDTCHAYMLTREGRQVVATALEQQQRPHHGLVSAQVVQNAFIARTYVLRENPWDGRQQMIEHESFFAALAARGQPAGFDANVTLVHQHELVESTAYARARHSEKRFFQYLCRNFPRIQSWALPFFDLDCAARTFGIPQTPPLPLDWSSEDDSSVVAYVPEAVTCFIVILSAADHVVTRDQLRNGWLSQFASISAAWDYSFFLGGVNRTHGMRGDVVKLAVPDDYEHLARNRLRLEPKPKTKPEPRP